LLVSLLPLLVACPGSLSFTYEGPGPGGSGGDSSSGTGGGAGGASQVDGSGGSGGAVTTSCANATAVLTTNCFTCHNSPPPIIYADLDLMSAGVAQRLVGKPAYTGASGACQGMGNLLNAGVLPATGILMDKILGNPTCGATMPYALPLLSPADQACLQAWANGLVAGSN
jgi:hypothetical protein